MVSDVGGEALQFCSNAVAEDDGTIWFTESTNRFGFEHFVGSLLEHRPSGRLFRRDPAGEVEVVLEDLYFANGVALTPDRTALFYVETGDYSVSRLWLHGPKQGQVEPLLNNLPGFPDNLSGFEGGRTWLAITNPRNPALDKLATSPPWVRELIWRLPDALQPPPATTTWAIALSPDGDIVDEVHGHHPDFHSATSAVERDGNLYLASPHQASLLCIGDN